MALCTWNGVRHLPELLDSLAAQHRAPDEIVIGDDGSSDETPAILERFARDVPMPVRIHRNETTVGVTANFSATLGRCRGDLVALADQDDVWWPDKLSRLEAAMSAGATLAFGDAMVVDGTGAATGERLWDAAHVDPAWLDVIADGGGFDVLVDRRVVTGCCAMVSSAVLRWALPIAELHPPRARRPMPHDAWLALCASASGPIAVVRKQLMAYRCHDAQAIGLPRPTTPRRPEPDAADPAVAREQAAWIGVVLQVLAGRGAPLQMPGVAGARRRADELAGRRIVVDPVP